MSDLQYSASDFQRVEDIDSQLFKYPFALSQAKPIDGISLGSDNRLIEVLVQNNGPADYIELVVNNGSPTQIKKGYFVQRSVPPRKTALFVVRLPQGQPSANGTIFWMYFPKSAAIGKPQQGGTSGG